MNFRLVHLLRTGWLYGVCIKVRINKSRVSVLGIYDLTFLCWIYIFRDTENAYAQYAYYGNFP